MSNFDVAFELKKRTEWYKETRNWRFLLSLERRSQMSIRRLHKLGFKSLEHFMDYTKPTYQFPT
jgi:hypothetical protein